MNKINHLGIKRSIVLIIYITSLNALGLENAVRPFEIAGEFTPVNEIDKHVIKSLNEQNIRPANLCSDEVFMRRVYLDVIGVMPDPQDVRAFLFDRNPDKRAVLIDKLLKRDEFADYWALKWCDILRVKAEFPINLWPNAVQAYHRWIRDAMANNMPYDQFARELLTSSGSNFRVPPVNFYRAVQGRQPSAIASAVALTFMGTRTEKWPQTRREGLDAFFSRIAFKPTAEWKEEIVCLDPAPTDTLRAVFPNGTPVQLPPGKDPRLVFTNWLIAEDNPWFARCAVNRIWTWLLGRGIIHEPDDICLENPPSNPELLTCLEKEFIKSKYDNKAIFRLILNSRTYQLSSIPRSDNPKAQALFAYYPVRQLDAEVLIDALCWISGTTESYSSPIPEPFTFIPEEQRTVELADGSISSMFLEMFGRPARDTGYMSERNNNPTDAQRLHLLNSSNIQNKIQNSDRLKNAVKMAKGNIKTTINMIYITILSRFPTEEETAVAEKYLSKGNLSNNSADLAWALVNTKEFLCRH